MPDTDPHPLLVEMDAVIAVLAMLYEEEIALVIGADAADDLIAEIGEDQLAATSYPVYVDPAEGEDVAATATSQLNDTAELRWPAQ